MNGVFEDLTGRRFGRLVVVKELYYGKVLCKCDCGKEVVVKKPYLLNGNTRSCGCLNLDISKKQLAPWTKTGGKFYINRLASPTLPSNNTSGVKGVWLDKARQKWVVEIKLHGIKHHIGRFDTIEEAAAARERAEEKYFKPVVEEYKAQNITESMVGKTFGYWTMLAQKKNRLLCRCRCGTEKWVRRRELERGLSKSCGCRRREKKERLMTMPRTEADKRAQRKYQASLKTFTIRLRPEEMDKYKQAAEKVGLPFRAFVLSSMDKAMTE